MKKCGVYSDSASNVLVVYPANESISDSDLQKMVMKQAGVTCKVMDAEALPNRTFRSAWKQNSAKVVVDIPKAKELTHIARRTARDGEMAPFDLKVTIPDESVAAEEERVKLRKKYADLQTEINATSDEPTLKTIMEQLNGEVRLDGST
jgi:hypothetical protein